MLKLAFIWAELFYIYKIFALLDIINYKIGFNKC